MEEPEISLSVQTGRLRRRLDEAGIPWSDLSSRHETAGTVAHYERTRVATPTGAAMACWGYSTLGPGRDARVYAHTLGYPDAVELWVLGEGSGPFALAPDEAAETISRLAADALREQEQEQGRGREREQEQERGRGRTCR